MAINKTQEREYARILYVSERITLEEIAERTKVTVKTIRKWRDEDNWDKLRKSLLTTRQNQLVHWYNQLDALNEEISIRERKIPSTSEADVMSKITNNIKSLEVEVSLGEYVEVGRNLLMFIQSVDLAHAKLLKNYFDEFINHKLKNG